MSENKRFNLDHFQNKRNLITHYKSQDRYSDWDFEQEGSALNMMIDMMSFNTTQNAFIANRLTSELLLGSTQKRSMAVSKANTLGGYVPKSAAAAKGELNITIRSFGGVTPEFVILPAGQKFFSDSGFDFYTVEDHIAYPDAEGFAVFENVIVYEGRRVEFTAPISANGFTINADRLDMDTLNISVDGERTSRMNIDIDIADVNADTNVYTIKETFDGMYLVEFGDGVFGREYTSENVMTVDYIIAQNTSDANGFSEFTSDPISGYADITVSTIKKTYGGTARESVESIKKFAPLHFSAADRAVSENDYRYLISNNFGFIKSVAVWGGEELRDKSFGNVFFSAVDSNDEDITVDQQDRIIDFLNSKNVGPVRPRYVDVNLIQIFPIINMVVNPKTTTFSSEAMKVVVKGAIDTYGKTIEGFESEYTTKDLSNEIEKVATGLKNIDVEVRLNKEIIFDDIDIVDTEINFNVPLFHPFEGFNKEKDGVIISTSILDPVTRLEYFLNDDGFGNIRRYYITEAGERVYVNEKQGTIDYLNGFIRITPFNGYGNGNFSIRAQPASGIIKAEQETNFRLSGKNAIVVVKADVKQ